MDLVIVDITGSKVTIANSKSVMNDKIYAYQFPLTLIIFDENQACLCERSVNNFLENYFNFEKISEKYLLSSSDEDNIDKWNYFVEDALYWMSRPLPNLVPCIIYDILVFNQMKYFPINFYLWFKEIIEWMDVERWIKAYKPSGLNAELLRFYYRKALSIINGIRESDLAPEHLKFELFAGAVTKYSTIDENWLDYPSDVIYLGY